MFAATAALANSLAGQRQRARGHLRTAAAQMRFMEPGWVRETSRIESFTDERHGEMFCLPEETEALIERWRANYIPLWLHNRRDNPSPGGSALPCPLVSGAECHAWPAAYSPSAWPLALAVSNQLELQSDGLEGTSSQTDRALTRYRFEGWRCRASGKCQTWRSTATSVG